jgi:hypothetical protein
LNELSAKRTASKELSFSPASKMKNESFEANSFEARKLIIKTEKVNYIHKKGTTTTNTD